MLTTILELSIASTVVFNLPVTASTDVNNADADTDADADAEDEAPENPGQYGDENLLRVRLVEEPLDVVQILDTGVALPGQLHVRLTEGRSVVDVIKVLMAVTYSRKHRTVVRAKL